MPILTSRQQFAQLPPPLELPADRPRARRNHAIESVHVSLGEGIAEAIRITAARHGVSPHVWLLAGFHALMHRLTGQTDVVVATSSAAVLRNEEPVSGAGVGEVLPIRVTVEPEQPFRDLVEAVRQAVGEASDDTSPEFALDAAEGNREPICSVAFDIGRVPHRAEYDLQAHLTDTGTDYLAEFTCESSRFDRPTITRWLGHYRTLLQATIVEPNTPVGRLALLSATEIEQLVTGFNDTAAAYPRDRCAHELIVAQVARTPHRVAVECGNTRLSYAELDARSNQLAHYLRKLGVGPDVLVGLCLERSAEMVVALLAIWKAGGAYVPLDPAFPPNRLKLYLEDSAAPVVITQPEVKDRLPAGVARVVDLDAERTAIAAEPDAPLPAIASATNLAYVLYTSGSTGTPNGVPIEHRALVNFLVSMRREPGFTQDDVIAAVTTISFDIHHLELWLPLTIGAKVAVLTWEEGADGIRLSEELDRLGATVLQATPARWRLLLNAGWTGRAGLKACSGGEPMSPELAAQLLGKVGEVWNMYGPTETTVYSTIQRVDRPTSPVPIGRPIANTQVYILDRLLQPVPIGCVGEIYIGGDGLARGYRNRPELTAARFVPDPFRSGERMYKTGDLGRIRPDGVIECLGRIDHQVKLNGHRIELGEVESALAGSPGVRAAAVRVCGQPQQLAAYIVLRPGEERSTDRIRQHLREQLPGYMIPASITFLDSLPMTPNGKVDRKSLPEPTHETPIARTLPRTDAERDLWAAWSEVLRHSNFGITDNFFDVGGTSLQAGEVVALIRKRLGHSVPLGAMYEAATVEKMAQFIQQRLETGSANALVPLQTGGTKPPLFMIAGIGGHVFTFHKFARLLGADYPVYGLKAIGVDGGRKPLDRFEDIAAEYVREITAACPHGPYLLSGYSIGAHVAVEVALQLRALGHEVPLVIVFDMRAPGYPPRLSLPRRLAVHARNLFRREGGGLPYVIRRFRNLGNRFLRLVGLERLLFPHHPSLDSLPLQSLQDVWVAMQRAARQYRPGGRLDSMVALFRAEMPMDVWDAVVHADPYLGWKERTTGPVQIYSVPLGHLEVFHENNIEQLARQVADAIQRATSRAS